MVGLHELVANIVTNLMEDLLCCFIILVSWYFVKCIMGINVPLDRVEQSSSSLSEACCIMAVDMA